MDIKKIKAEVAHLPHIKKVWIKNGEIFLSKIHKSEEVNLSNGIDENEEDEITEQESAPTPKKKK